MPRVEINLMPEGIQTNLWYFLFGIQNERNPSIPYAIAIFEFSHGNGNINKSFGKMKKMKILKNINITIECNTFDNCFILKIGFFFIF